MIGKKISPILCEIEATLWELEINKCTKHEFTTDGFRAISKIFTSALMDKMYELQDNENIKMQDRLNMVQKAGDDVRKLIKTYTNIDTHDFYKP